MPARTRIFTLRLLTENRVVSYINKKPPKPVDKPENEFVTKKKHENTLARAAEAHGRFWVQMHDFGHTSWVAIRFTPASASRESALWRALHVLPAATPLIKAETHTATAAAGRARHLEQG